MSKTDSAKKPLVAPAEPPAALISRLKYEGKFLKASVWLHNLIIHRIEDVDAVARHYRDGDFSFSGRERSISALFSQKDGFFCHRFEYYCEMIQKYEQGSIQANRLDDDFRVTQILLAQLLELTDDPSAVRRADRLVTSFYNLVSGLAPKIGSHDEYKKRIDDFRREICEAFAQIGDAFNAQERAPKPKASASPAATREDVEQIVRQEAEPIKKTLAKVDATTNTINNRDKKYRRKTKSRFTAEQQDGIYRQWMIAKQDPAVKKLCEHKPGYEAAIIQFRKEFAVWGASTAKDIKDALKARINRAR